MTHSLRSARLPVLALLLCAFMALTFAACGGDDDSGGDGAAATQDTGTQAAGSLPSIEGKKVALVTCEPNVFCRAYNVNLTKLLEGAGATVTQLSDNFDPALQAKHMSQAIAQKPDVIVLFASNADAIVPSLQKAKDADIPVVNVNARLQSEGEQLITFQVIADNAALGQFAAENLVEGFEKAGYDKGNVILVTGTAGTNIVQDRIDAFTKVMEKYPQFKVVATEDGNWDQVKSAQIAQQLLTKYRDQGGVQGAYGMADYQAAGIIQAADQLGLPVGVDKDKGLVVTASNCTPTGIPLMQSGKLWGNATQSPIEESDNAARAVAEFLNGKEQPKTITVKEERFTQENFQDFEALCAEWPK
jgi:ABC-type sugar transport system substrate-binding protein